MATHPVMTLPFDFSIEENQNLYDLLAKVIIDPANIRLYAQLSKVSLGNINMNQGIKLIWFSLLTEARNQTKLIALLKTVENNESVLAPFIQNYLTGIPTEVSSVQVASVSRPKTTTSTVHNTAVDVVIFTALKMEFDALIEVGGGEEAWTKILDKDGFTKYFTRNFKNNKGTIFKVATMWSDAMGSTKAAVWATELTKELSPRCLAMCGICAGRREEVSLGDVLVADRLFRYDAGKIEGKNFFGDLTTFNLKPRWKKSVQEIKDNWTPDFIKDRPISVDYQASWLLRHLDDLDNPDLRTHCPNRKGAINYLRDKGWLDKGFEPTEAGTAWLKEDRFTNIEGPKPDPFFKVRLGPIATGNSVVEDAGIFDKIAQYERKVIGLEMEGEAIGVVAEIKEIDWMIFAKGVCDYADQFKDDSFRTFPAKASAAFLIDFLKQYLPSS